MKKLLHIALAALLIASCDNKYDAPIYLTPEPAYITNGAVRLGIDLSSGGSIFYFSQVSPERNLLNHNDRGRFIQQSYYGTPDGTVWAGMNWCWNPIQGGGTLGEAAKLLDKEIGPDRLYVKSMPVHWATGVDVTDATMEEWVTLEGNVAHIKFRMTYTGTTVHPDNQQELPAVFVDAALKNLAYYKGAAPWTNDNLIYHVPGWPNEYEHRDEEWSAYVDERGWGIGIYTPGTPDMTMYRFGDNNPKNNGPKGGNCSYFAPLRYFSVTPGLVFEYDVFVTIGNIADIRARFYDIHAGL